MSDCCFSLSEALDISIRRIIARYGTNWAITGDVRELSMEMSGPPDSLSEYLKKSR